MVKTQQISREDHEKTFGYALEIMRSFWMSLRHPRHMAQWNNAFQAMIKHDFQERNSFNKFHIFRHKKTGVLHAISYSNLRFDMARDARAGRGEYILVEEYASLFSDPDPLTTDKVIPFVVGNYCKMISTQDLDVSRIPSPATGYVKTAIDVFGDTDMARGVREYMSRYFDDFKMAEDQYVIGFARLGSQVKGAPKFEYAYLY